MEKITVATGKTPKGRAFKIENVIGTNSHYLVWEKTEDIGEISIPIKKNHGDLYHALRMGEEEKARAYLMV